MTENLDDNSHVVFPFPGSPFHVRVVDEVNPNKVRVYGPGVEPNGVRKGNPAPFTVDATEAGQAPLECTTTDQLGMYMIGFIRL